MRIEEKVQKELERLAYFVKHKYDRMNPEQQEQLIHKLRTMFDS